VGQHAVGEQFALGVEGQHPEAFLGPALNLGQQVASGGPGGGNAGAVEAPGGATLHLL